MDASDHQLIEVEGHDRLWWLPAGGIGNGLDDASWVSVVDLDGEEAARQVLSKMSAAAVPAYAASPSRLESIRSQPGRPADIRVPVRIWVGANRFGAARNVLLEMLPRLIEEHGEDVIR